MKRFLSCVIAVMMLFLYSCRKEDGGSAGRVTSDSAFLMKLVLLDTSMTAGLDTFSKVLFTYDPSKRLSKYLEYIIGHPDTTIMEFRYTGNDTLPNLVIQKSNGPGPNYFDSIFLFYTANGIVRKDSIISWNLPGPIYNGYAVSEFVVNGSTVKKYIRPSTNDSIIHTVGYTGGNITSQITVSGAYAIYVSVQATYDNNPNPLGKIIKIHYPSFEGIMFNEWQPQFNNVLNLTTSYPGGGTPNTVWYTYKYRNDGFPISNTLQSSGGTLAVNKILYYYGSL